MTSLTRSLSIAGMGLMALAASGCSQPPRGWIPVLEETSTSFLRTETEDIATRIQAAKSDLVTDPEAAAAELEAAEQGLDHLLTYYLPLLEARERAYNAYRHYYLDNVEKTSRELDEVEAILTKIAESGRGHLLREMEEPLETLVDARVALKVDRDEARDSLQSLARQINFLLLRGGLILTE